MWQEDNNYHSSVDKETADQTIQEDLQSQLIINPYQCYYKKPFYESGGATAANDSLEY